MDALKPLAVAALLLAADPVEAQSLSPWREYVSEAASRFGVPEAWILRVIRAESAGMTHRNGAPIRSRVGAMGLMQLMPATWKTMRDIHRLGSDPDDPRDNILAGTAYLRMMYDRFGYPGLFGAYNAGPARYARHRTSGAILPLETRLYMTKVGGDAVPVALVAPLPPMPDGSIRAIYEPPPPSVFALPPAGAGDATSLALASGDTVAIFVIRRGTP